jgi:hypothetical protein
MSSEKILVQAKLTKSLYHLSDDEDDTVDIYIDEPIYQDFKKIESRFLDLKATSSTGTLTEIFNETGPTIKITRLVPTTLQSLVEEKASNLTITRLVEGYLNKPSICEPAIRSRIRCTSLKRSTAREICSSFIYRHTIHEIRREVFFF